MKVFKFGGASVKDAENIKNVADIIASHHQDNLLVVISAMGKTTNALEEVIAAYHEKRNDIAQQKIAEIETAHLKVVNDLFHDSKHQVYADVKDLFRELYDVPLFTRTDVYNFLYDQVICFGELLSTKIVTHYLNLQGVTSFWLDARSVIKTDKTFREGKIIWETTNTLIYENVKNILLDKTVVAPGFIGSTLSNHTTSLGREGSDFTASIFAAALEAEELIIWKDVPGVLNCDPRKFDNTILLQQINYYEAIEMTYYGAQVIHPKTIKPLRNKNIPLRVRSFVEKNNLGTLINHQPLPANIPPIIVCKYQQALLTISTKDFSFMAEDILVTLYENFARHAIKINFIQYGAIELFALIDTNNKERMEALLNALLISFHVEINRNVELLTVRHYNINIEHELLKEKNILIQTRSAHTLQTLYEVQN